MPLEKCIKSLDMLNNKDIGFVCCYFNPCKYISKRENFDRFYSHLKDHKLNILVVELAFGDNEFELIKYPNTIRVRSNSIMWQKEKLLNIGITQLLEEGWNKICWLDADIIFKHNNWVNRISRELDNHILCQAFGIVNAFKSKRKNGIVKQISLGHDCDCVGYGWAARRELLEQINLYEHAIVGGGDLYMYLSTGIIPDIDKFEHESFKYFTEPMKDHYLKWATKFKSIVKNDVGFAKNTITSMYHGDMENRKYIKRNNILKIYRFNPYRDIKLNSDNCFEWNSGKKHMHNAISNYFKNRKEDE